MGERWAIIAAVGSHLFPELDAAPYAAADATALADSLARAGYDRARQFLLVDQYATKAAIESRLRRLKKLVKKGDTVLAWRAGDTCWDTLPDDRPGTSLPHADWVAAVAGTKAAAATFLFSDAATPAAEAALAAHAECVALFSRSADDEEEHAANKHTLWATLVIEAFAGQARKAADAEGRVTPHTLQRSIEEELPRRLRRHFEGKAAQTPAFVGTAGTECVLADLADAFAGGDATLLDPAKLRRVVFRGESTMRVKDLQNYRKSFALPEHAGPSARKFFARIATADLRADLDRVFAAAREQLGTKRKDIDLRSGEDGYGSLRTPDFEYTVFADLDEADPTRIVWRREVGQFADPAFVGGEAFRTLFGPAFDRLAFEFAKPVDVAGFIDRLEDEPPAGVKVSAASDASSCDITLTGFAGTITVKRQSVVVRGRTPTAAGLLDLFLQFVRKFNGLGETLALPPAK